MKRLVSAAIVLALLVLKPLPATADSLFLPVSLHFSPSRTLTYIVGGSGIYERSAYSYQYFPVCDTQAPAYGLAWSPDHTRVAYDASGDMHHAIYVFDTRTRQHARLTDGLGSDAFPAWSPDGRHIAYACENDGASQICIMAADGSGQHRITTGDGSYGMPAWSPNGARIAFSLTEDEDRYICHMAADGSDLRCLQNGEEDIEGDYPAWSPDGERIAFAWAPSGVWSLYVVAAEGGPLTKLTPYDYDYHAFEPAWSPTGDTIAFTYRSVKGGRTGIGIVNLAGAFLELHLPHASATSPVWR